MFLPQMQDRFENVYNPVKIPHTSCKKHKKLLLFYIEKLCAKGAVL